MITRLARFVAAAALLLATTAAGRAASLDPVPLIETWLLPRYDQLVKTTAAQRDAWNGFCAKPDTAAVPGLQAAFRDAADAWTAVEFVTMGPVSQNLRADRFNFFPDRRNAIARALNEIIADTDPARLEPERFRQASAAVQGLPALERLLFDEGAAQALLAGPEAARRCALGKAIAGNLAGMAKDIRTAWGDKSSGVLGDIASGKGDPALFPDLGAVPGMILTDLSGAYQRVSDTRILPVLGGSGGDPRPLLAEGWRAKRSGRIVTVMIESADGLLKQVALQLPSRPQWVVNRAAGAADKAAGEFPADLGKAVQSSDGLAQINAALKVFKAAQLAVYRPIAAYFGISLGFNALDGD